MDVKAGNEGEARDRSWADTEITLKTASGKRGLVICRVVVVVDQVIQICGVELPGASVKSCHSFLRKSKEPSVAQAQSRKGTMTGAEPCVTTPPAQPVTCRGGLSPQGSRGRLHPLLQGWNRTAPASTQSPGKYTSRAFCIPGGSSFVCVGSSQVQ